MVGHVPPPQGKPMGKGALNYRFPPSKCHVPAALESSWIFPPSHQSLPQTASLPPSKDQFRESLRSMIFEWVLLAGAFLQPPFLKNILLQNGFKMSASFHIWYQLGKDMEHRVKMENPNTKAVQNIYHISHHVHWIVFTRFDQHLLGSPLFTAWVFSTNDLKISAQGRWLLMQRLAMTCCNVC